MKLVYTILGTYNSGGMERVLANKVNYLVNLGHDITIITTDQKSRNPYFSVDKKVKFIDLDINYTDDLSKNILSKSWSYYRKQKSHRLRLENYLNKIQADIVVSLFDHDAIFLHKIKDGSKKVAEIHFSRFKRLQYGRKGIWKLLDSLRNQKDLSIAQKYDKFVVLTNEDRGYWGDLKNIKVIPNSNSFTFSSLASLEVNKVLAIGRLDYQKGFDRLLNIWSNVIKERENWILDIYGHGPLKDEFIEMIKSLNLMQHVIIHEPVKDIKQVYLDHSILAMTSRYEGLPMALLEAQVCGLPMISYSCKCGPADIISDGQNGFLIPEGDEELFTKRLIQMIDSYELRVRMGQNAYRNSEKYSEDVVMGQWLELFNDLV